MCLDGWVSKLRGLFFQKIQKNKKQRPYNYRPSFLQNTAGWYNITWNGFTTKPYLQVMCILNIRVARFSSRNCCPKLVSNPKFHDFHNFASSTAMGPTMLQLELFLINFPGCIVPAERCAVISSMSGRRAFETARLDFSKIAINQKIAYIVTGHHFCKTPPAGKILLGTVLLLNRIYKSYAF